MNAALELGLGGKGFLAVDGLVAGEGDFEVGGRGGCQGLVERGFDGFGGGGAVFRPAAGAALKLHDAGA
ncbi:keratin 2a [Neisseria meningitidis]|nr:keratin 2a [Neisseria meningitidis]CWS42863.1 keratin 2a [Neisseria meningitidis]CWT05721.1 keratin 2a [Neisseria meningitidis]